MSWERNIWSLSITCVLWETKSIDSFILWSFTLYQPQALRFKMSNMSLRTLLNLFTAHAYQHAIKQCKSANSGNTNKLKCRLASVKKTEGPPCVWGWWIQAFEMRSNSCNDGQLRGDNRLLGDSMSNRQVCHGGLNEQRKRHYPGDGGEKQKDWAFRHRSCCSWWTRHRRACLRRLHWSCWQVCFTVSGDVRGFIHLNLSIYHKHHIYTQTMNLIASNIRLEMQIYHQNLLRDAGQSRPVLLGLVWFMRPRLWHQTKHIYAFRRHFYRSTSIYTHTYLNG